MIQHSHDSSRFEEKSFPIILILDGITGPANFGSLFRVADAFNIEKIISCGPTIDLNSTRLQRTARSTVKNVSFEEQEDVLSTCKEVKNKGYKLFALEITEDSLAIDSIDFSSLTKLALVLGNENSGVKEEVLSTASNSLHINMFGKNSSMNVAQAAAIALFQITKSLRPV